MVRRRPDGQAGERAGEDLLGGVDEGELDVTAQVLGVLEVALVLAGWQAATSGAVVPCRRAAFRNAGRFSS